MSSANYSLTEEEQRCYALMKTGIAWQLVNKEDRVIIRHLSDNYPELLQGLKSPSVDSDSESVVSSDTRLSQRSRLPDNLSEVSFEPAWVAYEKTNGMYRQLGASSEPCLVSPGRFIR